MTAGKNRFSNRRVTTEEVKAYRTQKLALLLPRRCASVRGQEVAGLGFLAAENSRWEGITRRRRDRRWRRFGRLGGNRFVGGWLVKELVEQTPALRFVGFGLLSDACFQPRLRPISGPRHGVHPFVLPSQVCRSRSCARSPTQQCSQSMPSSWPTRWSRAWRSSFQIPQRLLSTGNRRQQVTPEPQPSS